MNLLILDFFYFKGKSPKCVQVTVWTLKSSRKKHHSRILQVVVAQVQLFQPGGGGLRGKN